MNSITPQRNGQEVFGDFHRANASDGVAGENAKESPTCVDESQGFLDLKPLPGAPNYFESRFIEACDTMSDIRRAIHNLRMAHRVASPEWLVLDEAYKAVDTLIARFHNREVRNE